MSPVTRPRMQLDSASTMTRTRCGFVWPTTASASMHDRRRALGGAAWLGGHAGARQPARGSPGGLFGAGQGNGDRGPAAGLPPSMSVAGALAVPPDSALMAV
jgi:hypothetical protein